MWRPQFPLKSLLWLTVVVAAFCAGTQLDRYLEEHRADPNETRIRKALDENTELDFTQAPILFVIDYLKECHQIEIQLDEKAFADEGRSGLTVTIQVRGITLRSALKTILSDLDLTYVIQNGVLMITTKREVQSTLFDPKTVLWLTLAVAMLLGGILLGRQRWHRDWKRGQIDKPPC
jgi:hypothetical protein